MSWAQGRSTGTRRRAQVLLGDLVRASSSELEIEQGTFDPGRPDPPPAIKIKKGDGSESFYVWDKSISLYKNKRDAADTLPKTRTRTRTKTRWRSMCRVAQA